LLEHKYLVRQQVKASDVFSMLLRKHSFLADFEPQFS